VNTTPFGEGWPGDGTALGGDSLIRTRGVLLAISVSLALLDFRSMAVVVRVVCAEVTLGFCLVSQHWPEGCGEAEKLAIFSIVEYCCLHEDPVLSAHPFCCRCGI